MKKEKLEEIIKHQKNIIEKLEESIDIAIKYIGSKEMYEDSFDTEVEKLLKILKGSESDENSNNDFE